MPVQEREGKNVLVVDDDPAFCVIMRELLKVHSYHVCTAESAQQALQLLQEKDIDLILTDIMMPEQDGLTLIRYLRQNPSFAGLPLIVVSALVLRKDREAAAMAGADAFIPKPFSFHELHQTIRTIMAPQTAG